MPAITGDLLWNKLIWLGVAAAFLALAYRLFNFQSAELSGRRARKATAEAAPPEAAPVRTGPLAKPRFGAATTRAQLWARTKLDMGQVFRSPAYFVLLGLAALLSLLNLWLSTDISNYGGKIYPVTRVMVDALNGVFTFFSAVIAVYYAGELVWRERERRTHEIIDATPVADWMSVVPKTAAISLVLVSTLVVAILVAIATQAARGYFDFEIGRYLIWYVLPNAIDSILIAVLAVFIQALSPNKYIGWAVMVIYLISTIVMSNLGFEHNLYQYGGTTPRAAVRHERSGDLLDRRLLVPALLGRLRPCPAGAGLRPLAARDRDPAVAASAPPAPAAGRRRGRHPGDRPGGVRRLGRLDLLQHQHPQSLPHPARGREMGGGL